MSTIPVLPHYTSNSIQINILTVNIHQPLTAILLFRRYLLTNEWQNMIHMMMLEGIDLDPLVASTQFSMVIRKGLRCVLEG